jgi:hypothetical protein
VVRARHEGGCVESSSYGSASQPAIVKDFCYVYLLESLGTYTRRKIFL